MSYSFNFLSMITQIFKQITPIFLGIFLVCISNSSYAQEMPQATDLSSEQITSQASSGSSIKISLDVKEMDILDVLKIISMQAGFNIVAGPDVRGRVTIFLRDVDARDAFEIILASNDLVYEERVGIINVMTARNYERLYGRKFDDRTKIETVKLKYAHASEVLAAIEPLKSNVGKVVIDKRSNSVIMMDTPMAINNMKELIEKIDISAVTKVFILNYAKAGDIEGKLREAVTEGIGRVKVDERTNKIVITDIPQRLNEISKMITAFDEKTEVVLIEAKIVQIALTDEYQRGVDWDVLFAGLNIDITGRFDIIGPLGEKAVPGGTFTLGKLPEDGYSLIFKSLREYGRTEILSNPRIMVVDNEEAHVLVGWKEPVVTTTVREVGDVAQIVETVDFIDVGVVLTVTPTINPDGYVTMRIKPEISDVKEYIATERARIPVVMTSEVETTVMIKDGRTVVIGGLMKDREEYVEAGVPLLRNIPLLGRLFESERRKVEKTELAIFLTPHIVEGRHAKEVPPPKKRISKLYRPEIPTITLVTPAGKKEAYTQYYASLSNKILQYISENYLLQDIGGKVEVKVVISSDGELVGKPEVLNEVDTPLEELVIRSIEQAAPFPPFPVGLESLQERFKVTISLPSKDDAIEVRDGESRKIFMEAEEEIRKDSYSKYYLILSELISDYIKRNYSKVGEGGEAQVMFTLSSDGKLVGRPQVLNQSSEELGKFSIQAIENIAPFPSFPKELSNKHDTFKLLVTFPSYLQTKEQMNLGEEAGLDSFEKKSRDIDTVKLTPEEIYQKYKTEISKKISEYVARVERESFLRGRIRLNFALFSTGKLVDEPVTIGIGNPALIKLAIESVKKASPFPPFPEELDRDKETFNILISFE